MRTFIIALVIALLAGIIYQKVVNEGVEVKEVANYAKDMVSDMTNQVKDSLGDESARKETVNNAVNNVEEFSSAVSEKVMEEASKKAQQVAENILSESLNKDSKITCDIAKNAVQKIRNNEELTSKEERYIDGLYKSMLNTSDISKDAAFNAIELIYCGR